MDNQEETDVISTLTGFSLSNVLADLSLPAASGLSSTLGLSGLPAIDASQIYNDKWDDEGAVGADEGEDFEDEVDRELEQEMAGDGVVKLEVQSPTAVQPPRKRVRTVKRMIERPKSVYERFPAFEKDKVLDFSELFKGYISKKSRIAKRPLAAESVYPRKRETARAFLDAIVGDAKRQNENRRVEEAMSAGSIENDLIRAIEEREKSALPVTLPLHDRSFDLVLLSNWEDKIVYESKDTTAFPPPESDSLTTPVNKALESGAWTQSIIWGFGQPFRHFTQLELSEDDFAHEERPQTETVRPRKRMRADTTQPRDKFNLSNDHLYEVAKEGGRHRVRQTFGQLVVEHAYPAQKLQLPFYKTRLSKHEARSFHRPALQFPTNIEFRFSKIRLGESLEKAGMLVKDCSRTGDLTLKDTSNFVLWEYSEEHPPIIPNFGMGSILVNYYRKKDEKDDYMPKLDLGVPFVLEPQDESPFMKFGYVYPGQTFPALYNNLVRAPLFRHKPYLTDFLVVKSTNKGESKYYLREIKNLFVIGQTYPVTEVPGPHSRKITSTIKHRLQIIAFKLLKKSRDERLKISRLMKYFPDQNELQMRQRLKEFMEYHRRGPHQGFWRLKSTTIVPSESDMLKMVGPEQVVLMESMQVGQRHLQDSGYTQTADVDGDEEGESKLSIEQQLAPWITTKNFLQCSDFTEKEIQLGEGEAFSFIRISMKDIFVKAGEDYEQKLAEAENRPKSAHRYNVAEQQQIYKKDEPELSPDDEVPPEPKKLQRQGSYRFDTPLSPAAVSPAPVGPSSPAFSRGSSLDRDREMSMGPDGSRKVLRIKRLVDGDWRTEIIRDPAVIRAYVRARQQIEEETTLADNLAPTGDADTDKRYKKRLEERIARMKKNQERRLHRKNAKLVKEGGAPMQIDRPLKPDTTRRCGHCGQMGHMKTNRKCPRWAEFNSGTPPLPVPPNSATNPTAVTPGMPSFSGFNRPTQNAGFTFGAAVPSPLATSPPLSAMEDRDVETPSSSAPKIKLTLKRS
ncbi:TAF1 transcription initiation factor TFIID subunit TAF1 [Pisolithus orientalis]|uniref:TAF1 transcription initiation factor TFIID subunit TAF1 n=1 Tax=Pisolithus orientalis TaxID=936130 RepID=UPI002224E9B5|nr:TAF1 transcription initiation factor TFIID subunit TAF1 [Pisolithus orientalis]KAI6008371.1 TAF1 transcription initiation factor TFIID subunit TAF1 [Pisolithus orientalis]